MEVKTDPFKEGARIKGGPTVQGFWQMRSGRFNPAASLMLSLIRSFQQGLFNQGLAEQILASTLLFGKSNQSLETIELRAPYCWVMFSAELLRRPKLQTNNFEQNNNGWRAFDFDVSATLLKVKFTFSDSFNESESDLLWWQPLRCSSPSPPWRGGAGRPGRRPPADPSPSASLRFSHS